MGSNDKCKRLFLAIFFVSPHSSGTDLLVGSKLSFNILHAACPTRSLLFYFVNASRAEGKLLGKITPLFKLRHIKTANFNGRKQ